MCRVRHVHLVRARQSAERAGGPKLAGRQPEDHLPADKERERRSKQLHLRPHYKDTCAGGKDNLAKLTNVKLKEMLTLFVDETINGVSSMNVGV